MYMQDDADHTEKYSQNRTETETLTVTIPKSRTAIVHYYDTVAYYDKFSQIDTNVNKFYKLESNANKTVKAIRIADYHQVGTTGTGSDTNSATSMMTVPVSNLKIYKIYEDGTEELMSEADYNALSADNFNITYTYNAASGDDRKFGGKAAEGSDPAISAQFLYDSTSKAITVESATDFANGVYTLEANYKGFKTTFDIVFKTTSP